MPESNQILKALFTSETRIGLLGHFFIHPQESFYLRQLERLLKKPVGQLSRELSSLERVRLLTSAQEGNQKRYSINQEFPLYDELRAIFLKTAGAGDIIRGAFSKLRGIELAFVFGSFAKAEEHAGSDIDIMIIGTTPEREVSRAISAIEKKLKRVANYSLYERREVAKRLKNRDTFMHTVFTEPRVILIGHENDGLFRTD